MNSKIDFSNSNIGNRNKYILIGICATVLIATILFTALGCFLKDRLKTQNPQHPRKYNQQPTVDGKKISKNKTHTSRSSYDKANIESEKVNDQIPYDSIINCLPTQEKQNQGLSTINEESSSKIQSLSDNAQPGQATFTTASAFQQSAQQHISNNIPKPPPLPSNLFTTNTNPTTTTATLVSTLPNKSTQQQASFNPSNLTNLELKSTAASQFDKKAVAQRDVQKYFEGNLICSKTDKKNAIVKKLAGAGGTNIMEYKFGITAITDFSYQNDNPNAANLSFKATICEDLNAKNPRTQEVECLFKINDKNELELLNENEAEKSTQTNIEKLKKSMINYKAEISKIIIERWGNFIKDYKSPNAALNHDIASGLEASNSRSSSNT
jgi:hypothetical protein